MLRPVESLAHKEVILTHKEDLAGKGEVLGTLGGSEQSSQGCSHHKGGLGEGITLGTCNAQEKQGKDWGWRVGEDDLMAHYPHKENGSKDQEG